MKQNLDYTNPDEAVNFRDFGEFINLISGRTILPAGRVFRGGTIKAIADPLKIGNPKTIFCLQKGADHPLPGICNQHFPISNDREKYDTSAPEVRTWLKTILRTLESGIEFPLYVHCLSGRDRTGVVVAALLKVSGADEECIDAETRFVFGNCQSKGIS
jgi:protein-tyrosine phosphatase